MTYYLDYSAGKLSGETIREAGYAGAIRYIDSPTNLGRKHTSRAEYESHIAAGLDVYLVMEVSAADADGGFVRGVALAGRAALGASHIGYPPDRPIFFCNDRVTTVADRWQEYLAGAASILGKDRVGAYGFAAAMDAAKDYAVCFWQAGRRSDVRPHVNFWQDNTTQVNVAGMTCDRNRLLNPIGGDMNAQDEAMVLEAARSILAGKEGVRSAGPMALAIDEILAYVRKRNQDGATEGVPIQVGVEMDLDALADKVADRLQSLQFKASA